MAAEYFKAALVAMAVPLHQQAFYRKVLKFERMSFGPVAAASLAPMFWELRQASRAHLGPASVLGLLRLRTPTSVQPIASTRYERACGLLSCVMLMAVRRALSRSDPRTRKRGSAA